MLLEEKMENFRNFWVFDFVLYPKSKTRKSRKVLFHLEYYFTNLSSKNNKKLTEAKSFKEKQKIRKVLLYTQNRKLGYLGKRSLTSKFWQLL